MHKKRKTRYDINVALSINRVRKMFPFSKFDLHFQNLYRHQETFGTGGHGETDR